jgi:hypothetical protein
VSHEAVQQLVVFRFLIRSGTAGRKEPLQAGGRPRQRVVDRRFRTNVAFAGEGLSNLRDDDVMQDAVEPLDALRLVVGRTMAQVFDCLR